jgi:hypothetical protein
MRQFYLLMFMVGIHVGPALGVGPFDFRLVAETGQTDPDMGAGEMFGAVGFLGGIGTEASIADDGRVQFTAIIQNGPSGVGSLWEETGSGLNLVGRQGGQVAGMPAGVVHRSLPVGLTGLRAGGNADGEHLQVVVSIQGPGITSANNSALISSASGSFEIIAQKGDVPPGFGLGDEFSSISPFDLVHNKDGDVMF